MIITNAQIAMAASHDYREEHQVDQSITFWQTGKPKETHQTEKTTQLRGEDVYISARGFSLSELQRNRPRLDLNTQMDARSRINLMILQRLYESITGKPMNLIDPSGLAADGSLHMVDIDTASQQPQTAARNTSESYGLIYQRQEHYQEQEKMEFKTEGVIHTQDGREITISASLKMSRSYVEESSINLRAGDAKKIDPLVINFDGKGAQLSQTRFKFDLDSDGNEEQLASLRPGSGFLAWDRNGDGVINDGSELFGPRTGQGFAELAQFDEDGNNFIDEGDSIYHKLRIWSFNEDGSSQLVALGDKNIGAIFLGHLTTPFQLKDDANNSLGEIANSGIYLKEDGQAGLVQEINLTV